MKKLYIIPEVEISVAVLTTSFLTISSMLDDKLDTTLQDEGDDEDGVYGDANKFILWDK